jgi:hypothetical protein
MQKAELPSCATPPERLGATDRHAALPLVLPPVRACAVRAGEDRPQNRRPSAPDQLSGLLPGRARDVTDCIRHADRRIRPWLTGVHAGPDRPRNIHSERVGGSVSHRLLAGRWVATRAVSGWARDASILTSVAVLLIPFAKTAVRNPPCSAISPPGRVFGEVVISHHAKRPGQVSRERAVGGMTSVSGPAAAWRSGMSYMAAGCIWCGRD